MAFRKFRERFNARAAKIRDKAGDVAGNLTMGAVLGAVFAAAQLDRIKEIFLPSFWFSVETGNAAAVERALQKNPALANQALGSDGAMPLHAAVSCEQTAVAAVLLKYGAKLDVEDNRGTTPLLIAAARGHLPTIELLLQHKDPTLNRLQFKGTETAVSLAAAGGHAEALEMLHKGGARLDIATAYGETALTAARQRLDFARTDGRAEDVVKLKNCVDYLERNMADVCTGADRNANVYTPLMRVAHDGDVGLAEMMLAADTLDTVNQRYISEEPATLIHGIDDTERCVSTALKEAIFGRKPAMVECLLKHGAKQAIDYEGDMTPIIAATRQGEIEMLKMLLDNDTSTIDLLNVRKYDNRLQPERNDFTHSALTYAVRMKSAALVSLLLDHGARTDLPTTKSPWQMAKEEGLTEIVKLIEEAQIARKNAEIKRLQKAADSFHEGLDAPTTAAKPLTLNKRPPTSQA